MKKKMIALPLAVLAVIGLAGCSYPGSDEIAAEYYEQARTSNGSATAPAAAGTSTATAPADEEQAAAPEASEPAEESPSASPRSTLDLSSGDEDSEGKRYYMAVQKFSPTIDSWLIDGEKAHFTQYDCTGAVTVKGTGTLEPFGEEYWLEWDPGISVMDTQMIGTTFEITDEYLAQANGSDDAATPDKAAEAQEFAQMCGGLLDVVL